MIKGLKENPVQGTPIGKFATKSAWPLGLKSKQNPVKGITNFVVTNNTVYLLFIYDKSGKETLSDKELDELLQFIP